MAVSQIIRCGLPVGAVGATFLVQGSVLADGISNNRPNPAAVYAEPSCPGSGNVESSKLPCGTDLKTAPRLASTSVEVRKCQDTELEKVVMYARQGLGPYKDTVMCYVNQGMQKVTFCYDKIMDNICYLRTGAPQEVRVGTIVVGGLTGMLLGVRRGFIRKVFMGSLGAGGGAYLVYPEETEKYTKKYTAIAYNFVAGTTGRK